MKKRNLLLTLVLALTFTGGFIAGTFYSTNNSQQTAQMNKSTKNAEKIEKPIQTREHETESTKVLIGYVQDFRDPNVVNYSELTHVIFSFAHPTKDGDLLFNGENALNNLRATAAKAHEQDVKIMLAVGGWYHIQGGESYPYFKQAISNPASRSKLVNELVNITDRENLDGIDIDFEHPRSTEDAQNLAIFTKELSDILHNNNKELSIAVNAKVHSVAGTEINNVMYEPSMFNHVDHVNIMAYDGQWDGGYNAANLSPYPYVENIVNYWSSHFDANGISKEKLVLGVPFYAQPEEADQKQVSYAAILNSNPENAGQDSVILNGTTYYYNGEGTVQRKTQLAMDHGFGGMMLWEAGHDAKGNQSLTAFISETMNTKYASNQNQ